MLNVLYFDLLRLNTLNNDTVFFTLKLNVALRLDVLIDFKKCDKK
jgi:hypothetical protein